MLFCSGFSARWASITCYTRSSSPKPKNRITPWLSWLLDICMSYIFHWNGVVFFLNLIFFFLCMRLVFFATKLRLPFKWCINLPISFFKKIVLKKESEESQRLFWNERWSWDPSRWVRNTLFLTTPVRNFSTYLSLGGFLLGCTDLNLMNGMNWTELKNVCVPDLTCDSVYTKINLEHLIEFEKDRL